ncbi:MAG: hypothetical protein QXL32_07075, partial [Candidatus Bathyarchaeia archaeon]
IAASAGLMVYLLLSSAPSAQAASIAEWNLTPGSMPNGLVAANPTITKTLVFFADGGGRIGRLDPDNNTIISYSIPGAPFDVVNATIDDSKEEIWFTLSATGEIGYIDFRKPSTSPPLYSTIYYTFGGIPTSPRGITLQYLPKRPGQYVLWFAEYGANAIGMIDPFNGGDNTAGPKATEATYIYRNVKLPAESSGPWDIVFSPHLNCSFLM